MSKLHSPFLGVPLQSSVNDIDRGNLISLNTGAKKGLCKCICSKDNCWIFQPIRFSNFSGRNIELLRRSRSGSRVKCLKEPFSRSRSLLRSVVPLWKEGLLFVRCSVFLAVISGVCLLVWYGRAKAKSFIEAKLLPSVCSVLSEHIQRDLDFGKVLKISPLSITLESCSVGPHSGEFSCGEAPTVKLRVLPFSSLRRGKIVIDVVLSHPSLLIVQKKDFSWLGIPSSEGGLQRHISTEEGIDYRTKTRRTAREEAAAHCARERDDAARQAAEMGYIVSEQISGPSEVDVVQKDVTYSMGLASSESFLCMDERMHWRDHHCMDTGVAYDLKHAELEKSFGVKAPGSGLRFWSRIISVNPRDKFKRKVNGSNNSAASITAKRRILERSALMARAYFWGQSPGNFDEPPQSTAGYDSAKLDDLLLKIEGNANGCTSVADGYGERIPSVNQIGVLNTGGEKSVEHGELRNAINDAGSKGSLELGNNIKQDIGNRDDSTTQLITEHKNPSASVNNISLTHDPFHMTIGRLNEVRILGENMEPRREVKGVAKTDECNVNNEDLGGAHDVNKNLDMEDNSCGLQGHMVESLDVLSASQGGHKSRGLILTRLGPWLAMHHSFPIWPLSPKSLLPPFPKNVVDLLSCFLAHSIQKLKSCISQKVEDIVAGHLDEVHTESIEKMFPVTLDSVHFKSGTLLLLAYGDSEPREMENVNGHAKFQNHYGRMHVQLSGNCKMWRSDVTSEDGGSLSVDVFIDNVEQKWHANLKVINLFAPLFERILEIPIMWSKGRASGEVHICMSKGEDFPNLHGQLNVTGLAFQIFDAPSWFSDLSANLWFRGQQIFLHNASGWFGNVPLEASGDFGIHPEKGEFHLTCQVPCVEVNALMKTFKMKPLLFPLAGSVTAAFNCQGPLDAPTFMGSGMVLRKISNVSDFPVSSASEAIMKNKEAGAVAAIDRVPLSYLAANFTFNTDNCVADLYGIRASLVDGGEIRGAGNAWICPEGEMDDMAMDVNFSGNLSFEKIMHRYLPGHLHLVPLKLGDLNGETKLSGSLLRPRFDVKWAAPEAEGSFTDARGDIIISHENIVICSSSVAFELNSKVQTSYHGEYWLNRKDYDVKSAMPLIIEGVELDLRMRGFEFFNFVSSYPFDSPRPVYLKATGRIKFQGNVEKFPTVANEQAFGSEKNILNAQMTDKENTFPTVANEQPFDSEKNILDAQMTDKENTHSLVGGISISGLKLNQLVLAPQLAGTLNISHECIQFNATGKPDESLSMKVVGLLQPNSEENLHNEKMLSFSLQKGQLRTNVCYRPLHYANLEVRHLPLDELEVASLRGTIQRAELQLNIQKRRGQGVLSVLRPKFSGVLGEALDVAARWSGDVITVEKTVLEQSNSRYELQGEYVLPGTRDRNPSGEQRGGLLERAMAGHLGSVISSMGRWRMRLEVPRAEVAEMLPLARLLSRSTDPAVRSRSKDLFIQSLQSVGLYTGSLQNLLEVIRRHHTLSDEVILEDVSLPGLAELKGRWHGSLDASGGGNGDTVANFDFHGEDWEWGTYKAQRVQAVGEYSNDDGLHLEKIFIQNDKATIHADGTLLGPKTNLHFAVLNFPVSLVPTLVQVIESSATDAVHSLRQFLAPIKGTLHMEGDLRGSIAKPECNVQVRLLDGAIGGIDLDRAEIVASLTSTSHFLFNAKFVPIIQNGYVHIQGSVPVTFVQTNMLEEEDIETWIPGWVKEMGRSPADKVSEKKISRDRNEEGWDTQLAESLKGLNWNILDQGEVRIDADIKDGGMMMLTALSPYADWLHGNADIMLQVRGTVEQPVLNGSASFHRASVSSPVLWKPLTNFGGTVHVKSNRLCISSLESRVGRRGKLFVKGNLPLRISEASLGDKIDLKCEVLEVRAKNILSGQVDTQMQITGSILQPNISGNIKLSHGEAYLSPDKGTGAAPFNRLASVHPSGGYNPATASRYLSWFPSSEPAPSSTKFPQPSGKQTDVEKEMEQVNRKPKIDIRLTDLKLVLGPELRILYPLILDFAVSGELELNGIAHPKLIKPKGVLTFENGEVNLVATQVRLKKEHLNIAKFEPDNGLDPTLDLALVGSEWQFRIQSRASNWQDNLVVTSTRTVEQDVLSPTEAARVFESQLAESILEGDGKLSFKKLATATLETLMPRIEGKGEFGQARWRIVYAPQIFSLLSVDPTVDPLKSLASNISFGTEVEIKLGKRLQASIVRQMKDSEMAMQFTLIYQLTSRLRVLLQSWSVSSQRILFEYSSTSQN